MLASKINFNTESKMHDANGKELKVGDVILIPMVIKATTATEDYCNISAESIYPRKPDGMKETYSGNTAAVLRYNKADTITYLALDSARPE